MKTITDHELSKIAEDWENSISVINLGIKTAFAAGYRYKEKQIYDKLISDINEQHINNRGNNADI